MDDQKPNPYPPEVKAMNAAIAAAQGEMPAIVKDKTAKAGSFQYQYVDLASVISACRPVLAKHGLAVVQKLEDPSGKGPALRTELRHADGGVIASSFPLGVFKTPQELGSWVTYLRRFSYCSVVGVAAEEDDDGRLGGASTHGTSASSSAEESPFQPPDLTQAAEDYVEDLSAAQRRKIFALKSKLTSAGAFDDDQFKAQLVMSFGVDSVSGLSKDDASDLIDRLLTKEKELDSEA